MAVGSAWGAPTRAAACGFVRVLLRRSIFSSLFSLSRFDSVHFAMGRVSMGAVERGAHATDGFLRGNLWRRWGGVFVTAALAGACELASDSPFRISNPPALFMPAIVWVGFRSGLTPSLWSAAISWAYTVYFFGDSSAPVFFVAEDLRRVGLWAIAMPFTAMLVGVLHQRVATAAAAAEVAALREAHLKESADAAEVLRESERRRAEAERVAHVGWSEIDFVSGRVISSQEAWRIFGEVCPTEDETDDWVNRTQRWPLHVHPMDRARVVQAAEAALSGGPRFDQEYRILQPSGDVRVIHVEADVTFGDEGRAQRSFCVIRDITELRRAEDDLRSSEARFRTFVDHATDAFFLQDESGTILDVNLQACQSLGRTREELIGMSPSVFDARFDQQAASQLSERLTMGAPFAFDTHHRRKDGALFPVEVRVRPFVMGARRYGVSLARDVTERRQAEEALRESQKRLSLAVEASGLAPWEWNIQTNEVVLSPEWKRQVGYADHELASRYEEWESRIHPDDRGEVLQGLANCVSGRSPDYTAEFRLRHKDGSYRWIYTRGATARDAGGQPLRMFGCHLDVTDRRRAGQALRDSHDMLHAVIEGSPDAVFLKDLDGRYLMINTAGARFLGKDVDRIIGRSDRDLFEAKTAAAIMERDRHVTSTGKPEVFEETIDGDVMRTVLSTKSAFRDAQGKVVGLIGIGRDITELKRLEEQFYQAQKMEAVGSLAGGIAHDFNNLLTVISACSDMAYSNLEPDDPNRELLADIQAAGERAASLTRQLLAFSRRQVLQPQSVDVNGLLAELHNMLARLIGEDIELTFEPRARVPALVDRAQFEQAIVNLVVNARDAMPTGGQLHIETDESNEGDPRASHIPEGRYVVVKVSDSGHGMDEATLSRIFEPFFTTKPPGKGTGLGLAMAYGFVRQSGGQIAVDTELGRGATFKLYLPLAERAAAAGSVSAVSGVSPMGTETVLLVEDEEAVRSLSRRILQAKGYTVLEARNGREGLSVAQEYAGPIHLLLTDVIMPQMNGRELVDRLVPLRPELKTLFISGYTNQSIELEADRSFLQKPFTPSGLARKVREVLDGNPDVRARQTLPPVGP
jgi:two-component system, cell cycle sensor histidine kinase and response regulator CckA